MERDEPIYEVVSPECPIVLEPTAITSPVGDLSGMVVAELWDWRFRGDDMFPIIERELKSHFPGLEFIGYEEFGDTHTAEEEAVQERALSIIRERGAQAVISAVGA